MCALFHTYALIFRKFKIHVSGGSSVEKAFTDGSVETQIKLILLMPINISDLPEHRVFYFPEH